MEIHQKEKIEEEEHENESKVEEIKFQWHQDGKFALGI